VKLYCAHDSLAIPTAKAASKHVAKRFICATSLTKIA